jgi:predicted nucleic acid-binding Zn ribbon protein
MQVLNKVLQKLLSENKSLKRGVQDARMIEAWAPAVGETIAKHSRARQVREKTMIIDVDHPIWKQELLSNKPLALKKLNDTISEMMGETPGKIWIEDLFLGNISSSSGRTESPPRWPRRTK